MSKIKLEKAERENRRVRLELQTKLIERRLKILASYDATKTSVKRRQPKRETKGESDIYSMRERWKGCAVGRDLERNYSPAKAILHQMRMNVVGSLGKIQVNIKGGDEASSWFNSVWAKDCDYRDDNHFSVILQNVVASVIREGDLLVVFDDNVTRDDSGKLLHWESDQIIPLTEAEFDKSEYGKNGNVQDNGIIRDRLGKILYYICTGKRGLTSLDSIADATIYPREIARLVKNPWRLNQGRGVPSLITSATNFVDLYEILSKELQTAKVAASLAGYTKRSDAVADWDNPGGGLEFLPENAGKSAGEVASESAGGGDAPNYERFESLTGGLWEYLDAGDEVSLLDINRPNVHLPEFIESVLGFSGASLGMAKAYTMLKAENSYTAFRGDMILTWASAFYPMQKWLERTYADWVAVKALGWAQRKKIIKPLKEGWEQSISWLFPRMPSVDELKESNAEAQKIKNGTTDYAELLGPSWAEKLKALADQLDYARELNLPLAAFEQKSGGMAETDEGKNKKEGSDEE